CWIRTTMPIIHRIISRLRNDEMRYMDSAYTNASAANEKGLGADASERKRARDGGPGHGKGIVAVSPDHLRREKEKIRVAPICDDEWKPACRSFAVLCSRLCMHNELRSRNFLLKPFSFMTVGNNQLTIAYGGRAVRLAPVSSDFDSCTVP
ncbi:hypothetical protein ALC56_08505, partial [Trachymyrmex septentrionalis]